MQQQRKYPPYTPEYYRQKHIGGRIADRLGDKQFNAIVALYAKLRPRA